MRLQALHCPGCGAPIDVGEGASRVTCAFCSRVLIVEAHAVRTTPQERRARTEEEESEPYPEPEAKLYTREAPRFELSAIEQVVEGAVPEVFTEVLLPDDRFALVSMRVVDGDKRPVAHELKGAFAALRESLETDGDPGLAANLALEKLCEKPFEHALECVVVLFEPQHMRVTPYAAGVNDAVVWASSEEGRAVVPSLHHSSLDRKKLRERGDHFENGRPIHLAAHDLVVVPSAGFVGRGGRGYGNGTRVLLDAVNEHLGEAPLRIVTLAKNGFWVDFQKNVRSRPQPVGDVRVAAVRAILPPLADALPQGLSLKTEKARKYELAWLAGPNEVSAMLPLHSDRAVLVRLDGVTKEPSDEQFKQACDAILQVLDGDTGDNENPRRAGRDALEAIGGGESMRLAVVQLFNQYHRVKYHRAGWKQPISLGDRGVKSDGMQQFDEGGEATVDVGHRLFFPGGYEYEGESVSKAEQLAEVWHGGKASRLYEALTHHWKTKKTAAALEKLAKAAASDVPAGDASGLMLVTGL